VTDTENACVCNPDAWAHCGEHLCCPDLTSDTYDRAAAVGLDATDLTHIVYNAQNANLDPNEEVEAAIRANRVTDDPHII